MVAMEFRPAAGGVAGRRHDGVLFPGRGAGQQSPADRRTGCGTRAFRPEFRIRVGRHPDTRQRPAGFRLRNGPSAVAAARHVHLRTLPPSGESRRQYRHHFHGRRLCGAAVLADVLHSDHRQRDVESLDDDFLRFHHLGQRRFRLSGGHVRRQTPPVRTPFPRSRGKGSSAASPGPLSWDSSPPA